MENKPTQDGTVKKLYHIDNLPQDAIWRDKIGLCTRSLGQAAGSRNLYVNIDSVPPGAYSTRFHSHTQQEEFFLALEGSGTLHLNDDYIPVKAGDFFAKPAGEGIAHTFYNSGENPLVLLDVGTVEKEDTCIYPRDNMLMHKSNGVTRVFRLDSEEHTWTSDPNEEVVDENGCTTDSLQVLK